METPLGSTKRPGVAVRQPLDGSEKRRRHHITRHLDDTSGLQAQFRTVDAGGSETQRREQAIDLFDLPPGEDRHGAIERRLKAPQRRCQARRRADLGGRRRDIEHGTVEIEKEGDVEPIVDLGRKRCRSTTRWDAEA